MALTTPEPDDTHDRYPYRIHVQPRRPRWARTITWAWILTGPALTVVGYTAVLAPHLDVAAALVVAGICVATTAIVLGGLEPRR